MTDIKKIIYISWLPLTDYVIKENFIDHLIENNIPVEYWDLSEMMRGSLNEFGKEDAAFVKIISDHGELESKLLHSDENKNIYVLLMSLCGKTLNVYSLLRKHRCKTVYINWGVMPLIGGGGRVKLLVNKLKENPFLLFNNIYQKVLKNFYIRLGLINKYDVSFVAGKALLEGDNISHKIIPINMNDYENFKFFKGQSVTLTKKYAVFLDINLPYQTDILLDGQELLDPKKYYDSLNNFFSIIEKKYDVTIVVASHPKSWNTAERFNGRESRHGETGRLVRDAEFVISHHSTSLSYAVLNEKPMLFIYTEEMKRLYTSTRVRWIKGLAAYFKLSAYNIDSMHDLNNFELMTPPKNTLELYKYSYLTTPQSEHDSSKDIFLRQISKM